MSSGMIRGGAMSLALAFGLVACEPQETDTWKCPDVPPCSSFDYEVIVRADSGNFGIDSMTGAVRVDRLGFFVAVGSNGLTKSTMSCIHCEGGLLTVDTLIFTTDVATGSHGTLKAEYNFAQQQLPAGFQGNGRLMHVYKFVPTKYRDSLFEVRFAGDVDGVAKSGALKLHITNPALLIP